MHKVTSGRTNVDDRHKSTPIPVQTVDRKDTIIGQALVMKSPMKSDSLFMTRHFMLEEDWENEVE